MLHTDLDHAADVLEAIDESLRARRVLALRCVMEMAEQAQPGAMFAADQLAAVLSLIVED